MIVIDEGALICDFAETYHIFDYRSLPIKLSATLAAGLGMNSRIKQKLRNEKTDLSTMLLMLIVDCLKIQIWQSTEDGRKGRNRPKSLLSFLFEESEEKSIKVYSSGDEFEKERNRIVNRKVK